MNDIKDGFEMSEGHAYKLLGELEDKALIEKGDRVDGHFSYKLTEKAKRELSIVSESLSGGINIREFTDNSRIPKQA